MPRIIEKLRSRLEESLGIYFEKQPSSERYIYNADKSRRFTIFEPKNNNPFISVGLSIKNLEGGWNNTLRIAEFKDDAQREAWVAVEAITDKKGNFFVTEEFNYASDGIKRSTHSFGGRGYHSYNETREHMLRQGFLKESDLPDKIDTNATMVAFLDQVKRHDFNQPKLILPGDSSAITDRPNLAKILPRLL